jgi:hypothetical protein
MSLKEFSTEELEKELERREIGVPEVIEITAYLHGNYNRKEWAEYIENVTGYVLDDQLLTNLINAFYEIGVPVKINTITGIITGEVKL